MSFLKNLRNSQQGMIPENWTRLSSESQLDEIIADSHDHPALIFKHSTRCGISSRAMFILQDDWDIVAAKVDFYYLDLLAYRPISNKIVDDLKVVHRSPQVILIKDGEAIFDASHHEIGVDEILEFLEA